MLVKELIEKLKEMPQDLEAYIGVDYEYLSIYTIKVDNNEADEELNEIDYEEWVTIYV